MTRTDTRHVGNRTAIVCLARDLVLLLARIGLGVLMVAHAKLEYDFAGGSIAGVGALFEKSVIPLAAIAGPVNVLFEFVGGAAMILGLAIRAVGVLMALNMVGAWIFVHTGGLYALDHTGPELVIAIGLLSLMLAVSGSGRLGLDHLIVRRVRRRISTAQDGIKRGANSARTVPLLHPKVSRVQPLSLVGAVIGMVRPPRDEQDRGSIHRGGSHRTPASRQRATTTKWPSPG